MSNALQGLEPRALWQNFAALNAVPRPSKKEEKVQAFIQAFADEQGLTWKKDAVGNILVEKPASPGMEKRRKLVLQAHLDMVCQKNADRDFDFESQGIEMFVDGDWVKAEGTTLGADNGIGVATIMTLLASDDIPHPPLEALFTTDEEAGMTGAHHLQPGFLSGSILMNLDTEDDEELSIGCAGGIDTDVHWTYRQVSCPSDILTYRLSISGLYGGHSGMDIILGRGNANKLMNRLLWDSYQRFGLQLARLQGGGLRNAIPRESEAIVVIPRDQQAAVEAHWRHLEAVLKDEFASTDPGLKLHFALLGESPATVMQGEDFQNMLYAVQCTHDGIRRMSPDVDDLVETSNNLASLQVAEGQLALKALQRSDREGAKMDMAHSVGAPWRLLGAEVKHSGSYPGWKLDPQAPMLKVMRELYHELYQAEPKVIACHAGLECGLLGQHYPNLEMISFGPTIKDPHSPDERVSISSVQKFWQYFQAALKRIPEEL